MVEGKTYVVPKDDLALEKYPLQGEVRSVSKFSKGKTSSKIYIVKNEDLNERSENTIVEEKKEDVYI